MFCFVRFLIFLSLSLSVSAVCASTTGAQPEKVPLTSVKHYPIESFSYTSPKSDTHLSHDGRYITYLMVVRGRKLICVKEIKGGQLVWSRLINPGRKKSIVSYFWKGSRLVYLTQARSLDHNPDSYEVITYDFATRKERLLIPSLKASWVKMRDMTQTKDYIFVAHNAQDPYKAEFFRLYLPSGQEEKILENAGDVNVDECLFDHRGHLRLVVQYDLKGGVRIFYRENDKADFHLLKELKIDERFAMLGFTSDDQKIYAISHDRRDKSALVLFDLQTSQEEVIYQNPDFDVKLAYVSAKSNKPIVVSYSDWKEQNVFLDPVLQASYEFLQKKLSNYVIFPFAASSKFSY